jgi:hypothetical protein
MRVRVSQPMYVGGIRKEVGEFVDLPSVDALGAIYRGRAERVGEEPPAPGPMTIKQAEPEAEPEAEPKVEPARGKKRKTAQKEEENVAS